MTRWTLVLAIGAIVVGVLLEMRRRRGRDAIEIAPPPDATSGAPQVTG
jgi:hypothetical protein